MFDHELRASPPTVRQSISTSSRRDPIEFVGDIARAGHDPAGRGCLALDDTAAPYGILADSIDLGVSRPANAPTRADARVRQSQRVLRQEACATAVADDRARIATDLYNAVIHRLFAAGLQLQSTCQVVDAPAQIRLEVTIELLDTTISELRKAIFSLH